MFGFDRDEDGSEERFHDRKRLFKKAFNDLPLTRYYFWWLIHNCISHPLIGILPIKPLFDFHDWTSSKMHPKPRYR
jgi:hypothetical protein